ncbi:putative MFS transporter [Tothia fuscella]|uniref:MFS transporter n=1 Tax=Tothia fuscella TaxID=1048955 RepID=A0A9P4U0M3_9PEZI|nr:putative MFS transporter [Tothia fuscella]
MAPSASEYQPVSTTEDLDRNHGTGEKLGVEMMELGKDVSVGPDASFEDEDEDMDVEKTGYQDVELEERLDFSVQEELNVLKKLDRRVVLFVALLYLLSFLDRSNIGNARIAGLERDLNLSSDQYEWLLTAFYITYIMFEWMALLFRIIPPHIYLSVCVLFWGILASLQSLSTSFTSLLILRGLLGISEAAFAGVPFYLSFFFRRDELATRTGIFISAAPLATTFASSLAWAITSLGEKSGWAPWRLLFLVEGFPSCLVAAWVWRSLPDDVEDASFLNRREKDIASSRLRVEDAEGDKTPGDKKLKIKEILQALRDPKCYLTAAMFFSCNVAFSSLPVFLPTIIEDMGWSGTTSQALSAPPYLISFFTVLLTAYLSDKTRSRSTFIIMHALLACGGYSLMFVAGTFGLPSWIRYLGVYPATAGFFSCVTLIITWTLNNQETDSGKGTGVALLQYFGQCGPLLGTRLYPESDGPLYLKGMAVCAGFMALVGVLAWVLRMVLEKENSTRRLKALTGVDGLGGEDVELLDGRERRDKEFYFIL